MRQLLGVLKFFASLILVISFISCCKISFNSYTGAAIGLAIMAYFLIFAVYIYYLLRTALWNFKKVGYSINALLGIGFLLHLFFCIFMIYYVVAYHAAFILTVIPVIVLFALSISIYDFIKFWKGWKNKKHNLN
ncbi:MAG: hypothetical protein WKF85_12570 [Chitinophagaceae bacterium]